ncbi:GNAT family N-acetyltransferase [Flavobacterium sp. N2038]|uniref:GNAT family N-acetyltransferase n=1 Tax=Flavobacterium sp. N2038 TaxID=2986829 RepID=UPI0022255132|nr:GNAT family N-acetyltransferase [Flavobacterium sp. N2038]
MSLYSCLEKQIFEFENFKIVPIRYEDRFKIMEWRNEQIYHLRQDKPLTSEDQEYYFKNVISHLFDQEKPSQILFSFLENDICVGYGGLVHINWIDKNAEISFIMKTDLEMNHFQSYWITYLGLIEQLAFNELNLHKIYTYAFDLRPKLYDALYNAGFTEDARLSEHCFFESNYIDVVIHAKTNTLC